MAKNFSESKVLAERNCTFAACVASDSPSVIAMRQNSYKELFSFVLMIATDYVTKFQSHLVNIVNEIAADLVETRDTWKPEDFINFFRFLRQRQDMPDKSYKMTYDIFNEILVQYEDQRAQALEDYHARKKAGFNENSKPLNELAAEVAKKLNEKNPLEKTDEVLGKQYEQTGAEMEKKRASPFYKEPESEIPDEKYFEKKTA